MMPRQNEFLKYCIGLWRAEIARHSHPSWFGRLGKDGGAYLGQPSNVGTQKFFFILASGKLLDAKESECRKNPTKPNSIKNYTY